jgi:2-polyprenyl-6-methoxyphenol hydroxylase-like FAD-dependent oxidoreductase
MLGITSVRKVLIAGAGIAGLGASIALARAGVAVRVVERREHVEGTAIAIMQRGVYALRELGVLEDSLACGLVMRGPPALRGDMRLPQAIVLYRPELLRILREEALQYGAALEVGAAVRSLRQEPSHVEVTFEDGTSDSFDLVVGADGTHSTVRRLIHPGVAPDYAGHMSFRWLCQVASSPRLGPHLLGDGTVVMIGRLPERLTTVAVGVDMENRRIEAAEAHAIVSAVLARLDATFDDVRAAFGEQTPIVTRPLEWISVPAPWHRGRVALIGDAAHASTPQLSSGGALALEDACVLGQELERAPDLAAALDRFMARRGARTQAALEASLKLHALQRETADPAEIMEARRSAGQLLATRY